MVPSLFDHLLLMVARFCQCTGERRKERGERREERGERIEEKEESREERGERREERWEMREERGEMREERGEMRGYDKGIIEEMEDERNRGMIGWGVRGEEMR